MGLRRADSLGRCASSGPSWEELELAKGRAVTLSLVGAGLVWAAWHSLAQPPDREPCKSSSSRAGLANLFGAVRPSEGRLTGGFAYAPWNPDHTPLLLTREQTTEVRKIERAAERVPSAGNIADLAVIHLLLGDPKQGVLRLEKALHLAPEDACVLSDLAAAYLVRANKSEIEDPFDKVRALELAFKAV